MHGATDANPSQLVAGQMEQDRVRAALLHLPADQRQVIELRFVEDWSHEAVAAALGKTVEATRALQHRAIIALRRILLEDTS
jgi:RNA polymerase sigma-70 factor (ECF subfamily)